MSKRKDSNTGATYLLIITAYIFSLNFFGVMLYAISDKIDKTNPLRQLVLNNYSSFLIASIIIVVLGFISIEYVTSLMVNVVLSFIALQFYPNKYIAIILICSGILWMFADPEIFRFSYLSKKKNKNNSSNDDMIYYTGAFLADVLRYIPYMVFLFTVYCWRVDMQKQREQFYYNHEEFLLKTGVLGTFICLF
ncbi:MAG: hypothetical protein K6E10_12290, partial [Eubacterium sp.]|nr:hypothetical protein [Eubacterium sp.]